jgi:hypothetical protein
MMPNVVTAEMPRSNDSASTEYIIARSYVEKYQLHQCYPERCFKGPGGKILTKCKYGFPFKCQEEENVDDTGIRLLYQHRTEEDKRIVPYNLQVLLLWNGHINVQKVTKSGYELYLCKYISKGEFSVDIDLPKSASDPQRYLKTREVDSTHLGYSLSHASDDVMYLPTEIDPSIGYWKRKSHFPLDK